MAEALKTQGNAAFKEGRYDQAVDCFTAAIDLDNTNAVLFSNRSGAYASLGQYESALSDAEKAVALRPEWAKGYSRKGAALYGLGRFAEAVATYRQGLKSEPDNAQMKQACADIEDKLQLAKTLFEAVSDGSVPRTNAALQMGASAEGYAADDGTTSLMAAAKLGNVELVTALLNAGAKPAVRNVHGDSAAVIAKRAGHSAVVKLLPVEKVESSMSGMFASAKSFARSAAQKAEAAAAKAKQNAEGAVQKAKERAENLGTAQEVMGPEYEALMKQREERRQREEAEKLAEVQARKRREIEVTMRRKAEAEDVALLKRLAVEKQKADADAKIESARMEAEAQAKAEADAAAAAAAAEEARLAAERAERARQSEGLKAEGNTCFKSGAQRSASKLAAGLEGGRTACGYADAVKAYSQAIDIDTDNSVLYSNRSGAFAALANYAMALTDAERCVALRPEWAKGHTRRATALHGLARFKTAIEAYDAALGLEPGSQQLLSGRRQSSFAWAVEAD